MSKHAGIQMHYGLASTALLAWVPPPFVTSSHHRNALLEAVQGFLLSCVGYQRAST
jgi:hypothetical protein